MKLMRTGRPVNLLAVAGVVLSGLLLPTRASARSSASVAQASDDVRTWKELKRFGLGNINAISYSPDGTRIAVATGLGVVIRMTSDQQVERILSGHTAPVASVAWSPDGTRIASGSFDTTAKIWDARTGTLLLTMEGPSNRFRQSAVLSLSWSPDSSQLVGGGSVHVPVLVWNAATGAVVKKLICGSSSVFSFCTGYSVAWSPDGSRIAAGPVFVSKPPKFGFTYFRGIAIWDAASGTRLRIIETDRFVRSLSWAPEGSKLASSAGIQDFSPGRTVDIWDPATGALVTTLKGHTGGVNSVAWSSDGTRIISGSDDRTVRIWDAATGTTLNTLRGHASQVYVVLSSADSTRIASASRDQSIKIWDLSTGSLVNTLSGHTLVAESVSWSPDKSRIASAYFDRIVRIWDLRTGSVLQTLRGHTNLISAVAWSPEGSRIASASYDGRIKIWDAASGRLLKNLLGPSRYVTSVAWSADGSKLASGSGDSTVKIWDADKGTLIRTLAGDQVVISSVSWSPDGAKIAGADWIAATVNIWDVESGNLQKVLEGHQSFILSVAWSPDGSQLASAALDSNINSQVKIWDAATGLVVRTLRSPAGFFSVAWSPDGSNLATGSGSVVQIWDAVTGKLKKSLLGHKDRVTSVSWSADGRNLATASFDGTVRVWGGTDQGDKPNKEGADEIAASPAFDPRERESEAADHRERSSDDESSPGGLSFVSLGNFPVGDSPVALVVADFNGDGIPDVATANAGSHDVSIVLGGRDGKFRVLPQTFGAGLYPQGIAVGDFNRDGIPDLVVAQFGNSISVMMGNGDGTFQPAQDYQGGCCSPSSVEVGDFNGDGIQDLAVTMANQASVAIFIGKPDGTFTYSKSFPVGFGPRKVTAGDFNGDGILDLAVPVASSYVSRAPDTLVVLLGKGDGTFRAFGKKSVGRFANPFFVTAADFNGDGILDLATTNTGTDSVSIVLGKGNGKFGAPKNFPTGSVPYGTAAAALSRRTRADGSAIVDLVSANASTAFETVVAGSYAGLTVLQGNGDGTFQAPQNVQAGTSPYAVAVGDFNADGVPDLATANGYSNDVSILINVTPLPPANDHRAQSDSALSAATTGMSPVPADGEAAIGAVATAGNNPGQLNSSDVPANTTHRELRTEDVDGIEVSSQEVLVKFRTGVGLQVLADVEQEHDADGDEELGGTGVRLIHSRSKGTAALVRELSARPDVEYAEPNYVVHMVAVPNDPRFGALWGLQNTGQTIQGVPGKTGADIGATSAWEISTGSTANVVAVVDTGVDYNHPDLAANIWSAPSSFTVHVGGRDITCDAGTHGFDAILNTCDPTDDNYHGTHVSGTIGAVGNNGVGVVGVNWTTRIMGLKFLNAFGSGTTADAIKAIEFAVQIKAIFGAAANVRVLSNSWGGGDFSQALLDEIKLAGAKDMLFVAAAGNSANDNDANPSYPASYDSPNIVAVAATDNNDRLAYFSSFGATSVHLGAPGVDVLSSVVGGLYEFFSGTSMATPHVSGAAALVLSACSLDTAGLKSVLLGNTDPVAALRGITLTGGRLNVNKAIRACSGSLLTFQSSSISGGVEPGVVNPNDCDNVIVTVQNQGGATASGIAGTLSTVTPGVTILQATSAYPDIAAGSTATNATAYRIKTDPTLQAGSRIDLTLTLSYSGRSDRAQFSLQVGRTGAPSRLDNNTALPIPDFPGPAVESTVNVSGLAGPIANVSVSLYLTHTFVSDLTISLIAPDGTAVRLVAGRGDAGQDFGTACAPDANRTTFSDAAPSPVALAAAPFVGTFRPEQPLAAFNGKSGAAVNGDWKLHIQDLAPGDVGTLRCWSLNLSGFSSTPGVGCAQ